MKKNIFKNLETLFLTSSRPGALVLSLTILLTLVIATLVALQVVSFFRHDDVPRVSFELEDFTRMNLVDPGDAEEVPITEDEILSEKVLDEIDRGFVTTARRIFEREDRILVLNRHLPPAMWGMPKKEKVDTAVDRAREVFRERSGISLRQRLSAIPDRYKDHYADRLPEFLMEAFKNGVKVFAVIDRNNRELDVSSNIARTTSYRHFNRLYNREMYRLQRQEAKDTGVEDSLRRLTFYLSLLLLSVIVILLGIMIAIMRLENKMENGG